MDRDFLFGVMAVQLGFASAQQVMAAASAFLGDKSKGIAERLVADGVLTAERRAMLDALVAEAMKLHGGDAKKTLATLGGERALFASFGGSIALDESGAATMASTADAEAEEGMTLATPENPRRYLFKGGTPDASEIGRGGIGRVLIVHDEHLGREIAVKELLPDSPIGGAPTPVSRTAAMAARFLREARVSGQLEHPSIMPVYDLGRRADGTLYYTMKLVRGRTLSAALKEAGGLAGRLKLLPHFVDLCQAVAYAHSRGVVHRDLKPENAMLGEFGETVLLDWGLAKVRGKADIRGGEIEREIRELKGGEAGKTVDGSAIGTPAYMSPEQADGRIEEIDELSDVWSLGAVLYEVLTGRPPFEGFTPYEVMGKVMKDPVVPPREIDQSIPAELAAVAMKALSREKPARYESAKQMAEEVESFLTGGRVGAYEYGSIELLKRFVRRNRALSAAILAVFLITIAGLLLIWHMYGKAKAARDESQRNAERAQMLERKASDKEALATKALGQVWLGKGRKYEDEQGWLEAKASYLRAYELGVKEDARNSLYRVSVSPESCAPLWKRASSYQGASKVAAWAISDDGTRLAVANWSGRISIHDLSSGGTARELTGAGDWRASTLGFASDGASLFAGSNVGRFRRLSLKTGEVLSEGSYPEHWQSAALDHDSGRLWITVANVRDHRLMVIDTKTSNTIGTLRLPDKDFVAAGYLSHARVAYCETTDGVSFLDPTNGHLVARHDWTHRTRPAQWIASPDLKTFVEATETEIRLFRSGAPKLRAPLRWDGKAVWDIALSADGKEMILAAQPGLTFVDLVREEMSGSLPGTGCWFDTVAYSEHGDHMAASSNECGLRIFNTDSRLLRWAQARPQGQIGLAKFSRDERSVFVSGMDGFIRKLESVTGNEEAEVRVSGTVRGDYSWISVSPSGESLAVGVEYEFNRRAEIAMLDASSLEVKKRIVLEGINNVGEITFTSNGGKIAAYGTWYTDQGEGSQYLGLWNATTGALVAKRDGRYISLDISSTGQLIAYRVDGFVEMLDQETLAMRGRIPVSKGSSRGGAVRYAVSGKTAIAIGGDRRFRLLDVVAGKEVCSVGDETPGWGHPEEGDAIVDFQGSRAFVWSQYDNILRTINLGDGHCTVGRLSIGRQRGLGSVAISQSGKLLFVQERAGDVQLLQRLDGVSKRRIVIDGEQEVRDFDLSDDGNRLFVSGDREIEVWDVATARKLSSFNSEGWGNEILRDTWGARLQWIERGKESDLLCSSDELLAGRNCTKLLDTAGERIGQVRVQPHRSPWNVVSSNERRRIQVVEKPFGKAIAEFDTVGVWPALSADEATLAVPRAGRKVSLVDTRTWKVRTEIALDYDMSKLSLNRGGSLLAVGSRDFGVDLIDTRHGNRVCRITEHGDWPVLVGDGSYLFIEDRNSGHEASRATVVDTRAGCAPVVSGIDSGLFWYARATPNGTHVVVTDGGRVSLWPMEFSSIESLDSRDLDAEIEAIGFRANGIELVNVCPLQMVQVKDLMAEAAHD